MTTETEPQIAPPARDRLIRIGEVEQIAGIKRTMIYRLIKAGKFPQQFKPGGYASRWSEAEVTAWREDQRHPAQ